MASMFPENDPDFDDFLTQYAAEVGGHYGDYHLLAEKIAELSGKIADYRAKRAAQRAAQAAARTATQEKTASREDLEAFLRDQIQEITSHGLTDAKRAAIGLRIRDARRTPIPAPATRPVIRVAATARLQQTLTITDEAPGAGRGKPAGVRGAQVWCKVGEAPAGPDDFRFEGEATRSTFVVNFDAKDAGKVAYYQLRWVNPRGEAGPWSEVVSAMVTP